MSKWTDLADENEALQAEVVWLRGQHPERAKALSALKRLFLERGRRETLAKKQPAKESLAIIPR